MTRKALVWSFDFSVNPVRYAFTLWSSSSEYRDTGVYPNTPSNVQVTLEDRETGTISNDRSVQFILDKSLEFLTLSSDSDHSIVLENFPHQKTLSAKLKQMLGTAKPLETVEREDTISDQIIHYASLINVERYFVRESFLYCPDLVFDDYSVRNLIDPILTDEQDIFPLTDSFLIGCHYWDRVFKPSGFFFTSIARYSH